MRRHVCSYLIILSFAGSCLIAVLSLGTSLLGEVGDAITHVVVGLFGRVVAWLFVLELGRVAFAIACGRSFTKWRAVGYVLIAITLCGVLEALDDAGGVVGVAAMKVTSPWTIGLTLGLAALGILMRAPCQQAGLETTRLRGRGVEPRAVGVVRNVAVRAIKGIDVASVLPRVGARYRAPSLSLLDKTSDVQAPVDPAEATQLVQALASFNIDVAVDATCIGPTVVTYIARMAAGTKFARVHALEEDLSLACGKRVRVVRSSAGRVGFELPLEHRVNVGLRALLAHDSFDARRLTLPIALGRGVRGEPLVIDLAEMPHVLVAGATGAGKSVGLNTMLASLLFARTPDEMKFLLIDPKQVEFAPYANIPHLLEPVITDVTAVSRALGSLVAEMERRYAVLAEARVRNIAAFNARSPASHIPYIVVAIDEFADVLASQGKAIEPLALRLAQKGRACGVHMIIATQRPSVRVVSGAIKANIPARVCYRVAQGVDSRVILDEQGAEHLLGQGDALVRLPGDDGLRRLQSAWIRESEVDALMVALSAENAGFRDSSVAHYGVESWQRKARSARDVMTS